MASYEWEFTTLNDPSHFKCYHSWHDLLRLSLPLIHSEVSELNFCFSSLFLLISYSLLVRDLLIFCCPLFHWLLPTLIFNDFHTSHPLLHFSFSTCILPLLSKEVATLFLFHIWKLTLYDINLLLVMWVCVIL